MDTKFLEKRGVDMDMVMKKSVKRGVDMDMAMTKSWNVAWTWTWSRLIWEKLRGLGHGHELQKELDRIPEEGSTFVFNLYSILENTLETLSFWNIICIWKQQM